MDKEEISKRIAKHLEKILDDLGEGLAVMRGEEQEEMGSLFLVKRRMVDLVESCFEIYKELVKLRHLKTEES